MPLDRPPLNTTPQESPDHGGAETWFTRRRLFFIVLGTFVIVAALAVTLFFLGRSSFDPERVDLTITLPDEIVSGREISFDLTIENRNSVALEEAELVFRFPEGAIELDDRGHEQSADPVRTSIDRIEAEGQQTFSFAARLIGSLQETQFAEATLRYRPEPMTSRFEATTSTPVRVGRVPIALQIEAPQRAVPGQEVTYLITYRATEDSTFTDPRLRLIYPNDFTFRSAVPEPSPNTQNQWQLDLTEQEQEIRITGMLEGEAGAVKTLTAMAGEWRNGQLQQFARVQEETIMDSHPIGLTVDVQGAQAGSTDLGGELEYTIRFRNEAQEAFRELVLKATVEGAAADIRNIEIQRSGIRSSGNTFTWTAASVPELALLAPGEEGEVSLQVPLRDAIAVRSQQDKNQTVKMTVELETLSVPSSFDLSTLTRRRDVETKINTEMRARSLAFYNETSAPVQNSGPHPPEVGERTTYTIHWRLFNTTSDMDNVELRSTLPPNVDWTGQTHNIFSQTNLTFNERTREIVWNVGRLPATTGYALPVYEAVFQVALTPSVQQEGSMPALIERVAAEGVDAFTGAVRSSSDNRITTRLPDDLSTSSDGRVRP